MFKEREPEYARRRDDEASLAGDLSVGGALAAAAVEVTMPEEPELATASAPAAAPASSKRERRRQRRSTRPHGRAR